MKIKEVNFSPEIQGNPKHFLAATQAMKILESQVGPSGAVVTADWGQPPTDANRSMLSLRLRAPEASVEESFTLAELDNRPLMERRLNWLWGDLLQLRSDKQMERLHQTVQDLEGE